MDPVNTMSPGLPLDIALFIKGFTPSLDVLVLNAIWLGVMIPLLVVLFVASDAPLRRKPIFLLNVVCVIMGIIMGFISVFIAIRSFKDPIHGATRNLILAPVVMFVAVEYFVDGVLLFRVYSVFPRGTTRKAVWFGIFIPILILKIARLTIIILFIVKAAKDMEKIPIEEIAAVGYTLPETRIGWGLQLVDIAACSGMFLWKLKTGHSSFRLGASTSSTVVKDSYASRVKALFWIATSNFVFPALFNIVLIVVVTSVKVRENTILLMVVHQSDIYIEIIGVLFATVWVANARANIINSNASSGTLTRSIQFVPNPALATNRSHSSKIVTTVPVTLERTESLSTPTDKTFTHNQSPNQSVC